MKDFIFQKKKKKSSLTKVRKHTKGGEKMYTANMINTAHSFIQIGKINKQNLLEMNDLSKST